jgi:hypothetical protein
MTWPQTIFEFRLVAAAETAPAGGSADIGRLELAAALGKWCWIYFESKKYEPTSQLEKSFTSTGRFRSAAADETPRI